MPRRPGQFFEKVLDISEKIWYHNLTKGRRNKMIAEIIFWFFCLVGVVFFGGLFMSEETLEISKYTLDRINGNKY